MPADPTVLPSDADIPNWADPLEEADPAAVLPEAGSDASEVIEREDPDASDDEDLDMEAEDHQDLDQ